MSPPVHAALVGCAAATALISAGVILATHPKTAAVRLHAVYGGIAAWWLLSLAMVAAAQSPERAELWTRLSQFGIGLLPGVVYHMNVVVAGFEGQYRRGIVTHYALSGVVTLFCLTWPDLFHPTRLFSWGYYPAYTVWGAIPVAFLLVTLAEIVPIYRRALRTHSPGSPRLARAQTFYYGNFFAYLAVVDFLPAFGVPIYPIGYVVTGLMYAGTMVGSLRYPLIEITPEIAAEQILETMPDGLLVADTQGRVRLANAAAARLLGRPLHEIRNRPLAAVASDAALHDAFESFTAGSGGGEVRYTSARGDLFTVAITAAAVPDAAGQPIARLWLLRDVTEQRHAEAERERLESWVRQTQKMESLGVMAGGIAHDFNNILMAILGSAEIAEGKLAKGRTLGQELRVIASSAQSAVELTDQLLTYAGRDTTVASPVHLNTLVRGMSELIRSAISKKVQFEMRLDDAVPMICGDRGQLRQVVLNLVTNAAESFGDGAGTITLRTSAGSDGGAPGVVLEVTDTGAGMDPETQARVFEPFFTTKFAGRGLGLATVIRIVEGHKGAIGVESQLGRGSRFTVTFPAMPDGSVEAPGDAIVAGDWVGSGVALLADDEEAVRGVVREMLLDIGFEVREAENGAEAVDVFRADPQGFAVVVLDLTMPGMTGMEAATRIRSLTPEVPVVFISGYSDAVRDGAVTDGRTAFLHKPFKLPLLATKIRDVLAGAAAR